MMVPASIGAVRERWERLRLYLRENGTGLAVSAVLHLGILLIILWFIRHPSQVKATVEKVFPVDIVHLSSETQSLPAVHRAPVPQEAAAPRGRPSSPAPAGVSHDEKKPVPEDDFDAKLRALSQLRQPDAKVAPLDNSGTEDRTMAAGSAGGHATYSLRDFVRAQVMRHWNLDYSMLGDHRFTVPIRVEMTRQGVISGAEIVAKARYATDPTYHEIALSARNAVLLSSPIPLPPGDYQAVMSFTLDLNPRDTNR